MPSNSAAVGVERHAFHRDRSPSARLADDQRGSIDFRARTPRCQDEPAAAATRCPCPSPQRSCRRPRLCSVIGRPATDRLWSQPSPRPRRADRPAEPPRDGRSLPLARIEDTTADSGASASTLSRLAVAAHCAPRSSVARERCRFCLHADGARRELPVSTARDLRRHHPPPAPRSKMPAPTCCTRRACRTAMPIRTVCGAVARPGQCASRAVPPAAATPVAELAVAGWSSASDLGLDLGARVSRRAGAQPAASRAKSPGGFVDGRAPPFAEADLR